MNRREIIASIASIIATKSFIPTLGIEQCWDEKIRIDMVSLKGWVYRTIAFREKLVICDDMLVFYRTIEPCKIWNQKFVPDKGDPFDFPSVLASYEGPAIKLETGELIANLVIPNRSS